MRDQSINKEPENQGLSPGAFLPESERLILNAMANRHARIAESFASTAPEMASAHKRLSRQWAARAAVQHRFFGGAHD